jgi:hypothetical protein
VLWYRRDIIAAWERTFTVLRVFVQRPLVLLVKLDWKQGKALGSEEGKVMGSESSQYGAEGRSWALGGGVVFLEGCSMTKRCIGGEFCVWRAAV